MSVDQKRKRRFCGYCGKRYNYTWEEMEAHLHICEEVNVAQYRKHNPKKKE